MEVGVKPDICKYNFLYESKKPEEIIENLIPQIICKFPISDKRNIVVENVMINQIFPQGFKVKVSKTKPKPDFYCVVLDNQLYSAIYTRKYLACLLVYESIESYKALNEQFKLDALSKWTKHVNPLKYKKDKSFLRKILYLKLRKKYINDYEHGYWKE